MLSVRSITRKHRQLEDFKHCETVFDDIIRRLKKDETILISLQQKLSGIIQYLADEMQRKHSKVSDCNSDGDYGSGVFKRSTYYKFLEDKDFSSNSRLSVHETRTFVDGFTQDLKKLITPGSGKCLCKTERKQLLVEIAINIMGVPVSEFEKWTYK